MSRERLYLFDTTLRDGAQTNGVDFTLHDKQIIAGMLDELGIDYVEGGYPGAAGQGVASMLCDALEKLAGARGAKILTVDASDNAAEFFQKRGYVAMQRNTVTVNGEWLANTTMQKMLADGASPGDSK